MKSKLLVVAGVVLITMGLFVGVAGAQDDTAIRGGLLYDKWWKVTQANEPQEDHPLWATQSTNTRSGSTTWRCKECHGWDYKGPDGAYGSGSHFTGFPGVYDSRTKSVDELVAALKGSTNPDHDFSTVMSEPTLRDMAVFIQSVQDYSQYIDYSSKTASGGDIAKGQALYEEGCADLCHGLDGREINFGSDEEPVFLATLAHDNPQETLHKAIYGQPGSKPTMQGMIELGWNIEDSAASLLAYLQTLPTEAPEAAPTTLPVSGGVPFNPSMLLILGGAASLGLGLFGLRRKKN